VIIFGLFHGLVLLPVLLSLVGPEPYERQTGDEKEETRHNDLKGVDNVANSC